MTKPRRKQRTSLFRRLVYFVIVLISGGGAGGYAFQDHPRRPVALEPGHRESRPMEPRRRSTARWSRTSSTPSSRAIRFSQPGLYQVTVAKVELDQKLFKPGHTVDIQARVRKLGPAGRDTTLWDAKSFGSRLAVVGKDDLIAGWPDRPFQVEWNPGDQFVLEVYDARTGLFIQPRRFTLAQADSSATEFPLKSGDFPLAAAQKSDSPVDPRTNHVVLQSQRLRDLRSAGPRADPGRRASHRHQVSPPGPKEEKACLPVYPSTVSKAKANRSPSSLTDDGETLNLPRSILPPGTQPGDVLTLTLERDAAATRQVAEETRQVQDKLAERDPGGDIKL